VREFVTFISSVGRTINKSAKCSANVNEKAAPARGAADLEQAKSISFL